MRSIVVLITFSFLANYAFADQCINLSSSQANKVMDILTTSDDSELFVIDRFCEHCSEYTYPKPILVNSYRINKTAESKRQIIINRKVTDLTYIYVQGRNIATLIGCKPLGVSRNLD